MTIGMTTFRLHWRNGDEAEFSPIFITNISLPHLIQIISEIREKDNYTVEQLIQYIIDGGYSIRILEIAELEF